MNACQGIWFWTTSIHTTCYSNMLPNSIDTALLCSRIDRFPRCFIKTFYVHILSHSPQLTCLDYLVFTIHMALGFLYTWRISTLINIPNILVILNRDRVVGIATSYGLDDQGVGVRVPVGSRIFSSPNRPDRLWGPPNLLSNGYRGFFPRG
jgi:hypothetical protein